VADNLAKQEQCAVLAHHVRAFQLGIAMGRCTVPPAFRQGMDDHIPAWPFARVNRGIE
jgi:hypothetical protein